MANITLAQSCRTCKFYQSTDLIVFESMRVHWGEHSRVCFGECRTVPPTLAKYDINVRTSFRDANNKYFNDLQDYLIFVYPSTNIINEDEYFAKVKVDNIRLGFAVNEYEQEIREYYKKFVAYYLWWVKNHSNIRQTNPLGTCANYILDSKKRPSKAVMKILNNPPYPY